MKTCRYAGALYLGFLAAGWERVRKFRVPETGDVWAVMKPPA